MSTALDLDTELLLGLEEHRSCEHNHHGADGRVGTLHQDGNERFVRYLCDKCGPGPVVVRCQRWVDVSRNAADHGVYVSCSTCGWVTFHTRYMDLGPANGEES